MNPNHYGPGTEKGGQFAPKAAIESKNDFIKENGLEAWNENRQGFLNAFNEERRRLWSPKNKYEMTESEKLDAILKLSDEYHGALEWEDMDENMRNHFIDDKVVMKLFENSVAPKIKDMFGDGFTGNYAMETDPWRDIHGCDLTLETSDGKYLNVDLKGNAKSMRQPDDGKDDSFVMKLSNSISTMDELVPSNFMKPDSSVLTDEYMFIKIKGMGVGQRELFNRIYKHGQAGDDIVMQNASAVSCFRINRGNVRKAILQGMGFDADSDFQGVMNDAIGDMGKALSSFSLMLSEDKSIEVPFDKPVSLQSPGGNTCLIQYSVPSKTNRDEAVSVNVIRTVPLGNSGATMTLRLRKTFFYDDRNGNPRKPFSISFMSIDGCDRLTLDGKPVSQTYKIK